MKRKLALSLLTFAALGAVLLTYTRQASSSSSDQRPVKRAFLTSSNLSPFFVTTFDVDITNDDATATACTPADGDCSLRGAIIAANTNLSPDPVEIILQPATTYSLTITNATQENAAATGDLDITTTIHSVKILGGDSSGPNATIIDASALTSGTSHDRVFQLTGPGVTAIFQDLAIQDGQAADDGRSGASTNPAIQNFTRVGGGILNGAGIDADSGAAINGGGSLTLTNVVIDNCKALGKGDDIINQHRTLDAQGGGLASLGTGSVVVTNSTFTGNSALGGNGGDFNNGNASNARGGSIYLQGGTLNINGSRIEASLANGGNGGNQNQNGQTNGGAGGTAQGGGVYVGGGTATINNTTFDDTEANGGNSGTGGNGVGAGGNAEGGGLYSVGNVTVTNSTFHLAEANGGDGGNAFGTTCLGGHQAGDGGAGRGGAILADGGTMTINTATFANNLATGGNGGDGGQTDGGLNCGMHGAGGLAHGGAITNNNAATLNIKHGTISLNNAQAGNTGVNQPGATKPPRDAAEGTGGGVRVGPSGATFENTIISGNTAANGLGANPGAFTPGPNVDGTVTSNGHNLLNIATEAVGFTGTGDLVGANPMLAALADNGGPTQTMELQAGSDAIDAGVAAGATFDQRGKPRTFDDLGVPNEATSDGTDIGAFELQPECTLTCPEDIGVNNDPGACGAIVNYEEPTGENCGTVTCDFPSGSFFPVGSTVVTCTSSVGPTCSFVVNVTDVEAPVITTSDPITLWPPNHKYTTLNLTDLVTSATDNCPVVLESLSITKVTSDEPENTTGDGNTLNDIVIADDCQSVKLRAERIGSGNGRVYTITFSLTDASGNTGTATVKVRVPKSQNGGLAVDDGPSYTVLGTCGGTGEGR